MSQEVPVRIDGGDVLAVALEIEDHTGGIILQGHGLHPWGRVTGGQKRRQSAPDFLERSQGWDGLVRVPRCRRRSGRTTRLPRSQGWDTQLVPAMTQVTVVTDVFMTRACGTYARTSQDCHQ